MFSFYDSRDKTAVMAKRMKYFTNAGKKSYKFILIHALVSLNTISDENPPFHF